MASRNLGPQRAYFTSFHKVRSEVTRREGTSKGGRLRPRGGIHLYIGRPCHPELIVSSTSLKGGRPILEGLLDAKGHARLISQFVLYPNPFSAYNGIYKACLFCLYFRFHCKAEWSDSGTMNRLNLKLTLLNGLPACRFLTGRLLLPRNKRHQAWWRPRGAVEKRDLNWG